MRCFTLCSPARSFPAVKFKRPQIVVAGLALLAGGAALHALIAAGNRSVKTPEQSIEVGGYRTFAADCLWLETNLAWETKDASRARRMIDFTVSADPQSPYFWLNSARMLAYDFPVWRCQDDRLAPVAVQTNWRLNGAHEALLLLDRGQRWHGHSAVLHLEMANICLYALGDRHRAAEHYRRASEQADAPEYAARIYARLHAEEIAEMTLTR